MRLLREPDAATAVQWLRGELAAQNDGGVSAAVLQLVGTCEVAYAGRTRTHMPAGTRLVLVKPEGTVLVHGPTGAKPQNWQPAGSSLDAALDGGCVVLTARRAKQQESLTLRFTSVDLLAALRLTAREGAMVGTEDDLQALLFAHPELVEPGFVAARRERDSARGYYDLDGHDALGRRLIVEVKRGTAGVSDAQQLWRYVEALRGSDDHQQAAVRGILVAPTVAPKARALLAAQKLEWREVDWDDLLPKVEAMRHAGQASLARF